jgi:molecular chaperone GrpE
MTEKFKKLFNMKENDTSKSEQELDETNLESMENIENTLENSEIESEETKEQTKIAQLQTQVEEAKSKYIYLLSDFENYKRNAAKDRNEMRHTAGRDILSALVPILDDFDRAAKVGEGLSEGMTLIQTKLVNTVVSKGLVKMDINAGEEFNADFQEAVVEIPAPTPELSRKIVDVIESGYMLGDKVLRFAKVVVGK